VLNTTADGSLYFTVRDLVAWNRVVRGRTVLSKASWEKMLTPARLTSGKHYPYGFGWSVDTAAGQVVTSHGGAWQGFSTYFARWNGDDLSVMVLGNRAGAPTGEVAQGIGEVFNPALREPAEAPIADPDPAAAAQLRQLLTTIAEGKLQPADFAYVRAGFFPAAANRYRDLFAPLGAPREFQLLSRSELGDDVIRRYRVTFASRVATVTWAVAPDGKVAQFSASVR
jgi:hypothetical protein